MTLVSGIFVGALVVWRTVQPNQTLLATIMFLAALGLTSASFWHTHLAEREPGQNFLYVQAVLDVVLVTGIVHITGGGESAFAPLYILVISAGALLLPFRGGVLIGALVSILYLADIVASHPEAVKATLGLQIGLFAVVALVTGWLGDRLRRAGVALGAVESELRQLRLDTGDILDSVTTGVLTVDGARRLVYMNAAAERLLGLDAGQWSGAEVLPRVERVAPGLGSLLRRSLDEHRPMARYKTVARQDGRDVVLGISTTVLEREDDPPSVTAIFQDITDQERLEAVNRRAERLEAVAELSASLAHEIKNPLASIRSAVEQLTHTGLGNDDRHVLQRLVISESERLSRLLSEFIEFSRVRLGQVEQVDLAAVVKECLALVRQHPDARGEIDIAETGVDQPILIPGDTDLLHRAVFNLLLNAVQFSPRPGRVEVEVCEETDRMKELGLDIPDPVRITIRDSGPGIRDEDLSRIFDPFFTTREGGSGLGLAMVHRAVEAHAGTVFVDQREARGTEFTIYLPGEPLSAEGDERS